MPNVRSSRVRKTPRVRQGRRAFQFVTTVQKNLDVDRELKLRYGLVSYLAEFGLRCIGGVEGGWVSCCGGHSLTERDRGVLRAWLSSQVEIISAEIGPLVDDPDGMPRCDKGGA